MTLSPPLLVASVAAGLALGSFAVTSGLRMAGGGPLLAARSRCDGCGRSLTFAETVPLASFLAARGACRACRTAIDPAHLVGEVAGGLVVAAGLFIASPARAAATIVLGLVLLAAAATDWRSRRLPDVLTVAVAVLALGLSLSAGLGPALSGLLASVLTVLALLGLRRLAAGGGRDPGLGLGDVKLAGALALWLGAVTPWMFVVAALVGLAMIAALRPADGRLAFGPALALAGWGLGLIQELGLWPTML